jgi:hypothetical protein
MTTTRAARAFRPGRRIDIPSLPNLRDIGGYATATGGASARGSCTGRPDGWRMPETKGGRRQSSTRRAGHLPPTQWPLVATAVTETRVSKLLGRVWGDGDLDVGVIHGRQLSRRIADRRRPRSSRAAPGGCWGHAPAGRRPCPLRHLTAGVPECAGIQPSLRWQQKSPNDACLQGIHPRRRPTTASKPTRRSLQSQNPCKSPSSDGQEMHRTAGPQSQVDDKTLQIVQNHGARGTRTPDLLGAIHQLRARDRREKLTISRDFPMVTDGGGGRGSPLIAADPRGVRHSWR